MDEVEEFGSFIAGFVSGEGCFYIYFAKAVSPLPVVMCAFSIKLRADDYDLLRSIWVALDYPGRIYRIPTKRYRYAWDSVQRHDMDKDNPTGVDQSHDANANLPDSQ